MIVTILRQIVPFALAGGATIMAISAIAPAAAADASQWDSDTHSAVRLIAGSRRGEPLSTTIRAGIEIKLDPGWKTYWRYPGDSGVPPRFDFEPTENLKSITVSWPAPLRLKDDGGHSIGYLGGVILPLAIVPQDPAKPVMLRLKIDYAVCAKICIPAAGKAELLLAGGPSVHETALAAMEARAPKLAAVGEPGPLAIRAVRRETGAGKSRILVDVIAPEHVAVDLFAEGPNPDWALPLPEPVTGAPAGTRRFAFALDGIPPGGKTEGATLRLTATAGGHAIEVTTHLD